MDRYLQDGRWVSAAVARRALQRAEVRLRELGMTAADRDGAALIRHGWQAVAARPEWSAELRARAEELHGGWLAECIAAAPRAEVGR
jgi:hypothetical protein